MKELSKSQYQSSITKLKGNVPLYRIATRKHEFSMVDLPVIDFSVCDGRKAIPCVNPDAIVSEAAKLIIVAKIVV